MAAYHSLDLRDYRDPKHGNSSGGSYILIVGNAFAHKYVSATVDALTTAFPREKIVALGPKEDTRHNVTTYASGHLTDEQMHNLLHGARVVVFPSHYEGFGIPVVESLAYGKPVLARSIPVIRELREKLPAKDNLILYGSTKDLMARLEEGFPKWQYGAKEANANHISWNSGTAEMGEFLRGLVVVVVATGQLLPRLAFMRVLEDHRHELQGPLPGAETATPRMTRRVSEEEDRSARAPGVEEIAAGPRPANSGITELVVMEDHGAGPGFGESVCAEAGSGNAGERNRSAKKPGKEDGSK